MIMAKMEAYKPEYSNTWALIIGINKYEQCPPLQFATNDAKELAELLQTKFAFPKENITILLDQEAKASSIRKAFFEYVTKTKPDDRLLVFFAGHGQTIPGRRRDSGFLIPQDGNGSQLESMIPWDELTRHADSIPAKHLFFIMDACYGGLAITRSNAFGSVRFVRDMLQRHGRQVLAAGKADETVADGSGVREGHSIFTAHLLNGLDGAAATKDGIITAQSLMAYTYEHVGHDQYSQQTPHFGFLEGDGDFIFDTSVVDRLIASAKPEEITPGEKLEADKLGEPDVLINTAPTISNVLDEQPEIVTKLKDLLAFPEKRIQLDDFVSYYTRTFLEKSDLRHFPVNHRETVTKPEKILERMKAYEGLTRDLQKIVILIANWGNAEQLKQLERIFIRLAETDKGSSGFSFLMQLSWYPIMLLMYSAGISAIANKNYAALRIILRTPIQANSESKRQPVVVPVMSKLSDAHDGFKSLPGYEQKYVPRSEYLFKELQPILEDLLFLGQRYEDYFDEFEVLLALSYAYETERKWGPPGRFAWKHSSPFRGETPYSRILTEAALKKEEWEPIKAGVFDKLEGKFNEQAQAYKERLDNLHW